MTHRFTLLALVVLFAARTDARAQTLDPFNAGFPNAGLPQIVHVIAIQPDDKILIGGTFANLGVGCSTQACPTERQNLARLHPDGALDLGFNPGTNGPVDAIAVQPDGRIVVSGGFTLIGGGGSGSIPRAYVARLNADGTVDETFNSGANEHVFALLIQPDGKILVGGSFTSLGTGTGAMVRNRIGRLNPDGTVDTSFDPGANDSIYALAPQPDGRIIAGGHFTMIGGGGTGTFARTWIARLQPDGTADAFSTGVGHYLGPNIKTVAVQPDGRIVVGGFFETLNSYPRIALGRLMGTGATDPSLNADLSIADWPEFSYVHGTVLQTDGRIIAVGLFEFMGVEDRMSLGRLDAGGSRDGFYTAALGVFPQNHMIEVPAAVLDSRGRLLVGGTFTVSNGAARNTLARFTNTHPATQSLTILAGGTGVQWMRGGSSPEVDRVTFESTTDGQTWTLLGAGARIVGGWELTGLAVPATAVVRARGFVGGSIYERVLLPSNVDVVRNGDFGGGLNNWLTFATPDDSYIVASINNGALEFSRLPGPAGALNQAVVLQRTGIPVPARTRLEAQFDLGNTDTLRKRIAILVHDSAFGDLSFCTFWLEPQAPMRTYRLVTHNTQPWTNATISFYAATAGSAGGFYRVDNVSLQQSPGGAAAEETTCTDPTAPGPPGGADGPSLLVNGDFGSGDVAPGWGLFGQITGSVTGGVFQFVRPSGVPAGAILQPTGVPLNAGEAIAATFQLGNSSAVRKRVTVIVHDRNFSDLAACVIWLEPGQPLTDYTLRTFAAHAWADTTLSFYSATIGPEAAIQLDNATLRRTPSATVRGTECLNHGQASIAPLPVSARSGVTAATVTRARAGQSSLRLADPVSVSFTDLVRLVLRLRPLEPAERVLVQISRDGVTWETILEIAPEDSADLISIDLSRYVGQAVLLRILNFKF